MIKLESAFIICRCVQAEASWPTAVYDCTYLLPALQPWIMDGEVQNFPCSVELQISCVNDDRSILFRYGIRRQSVNKVAVASARTSWIETKRSIETKGVSRKAAQGGNRRSECKKSQGNEPLTGTMDLRVRPIRYLYSRVGTSVDGQIQTLTTLMAQLQKTLT